MLEQIEKQIIDVRMKNRMNEYIEKILKENGKIKKRNNIIIKNDNKKLIIKIDNEQITYIYKENNYKEKYQIIKINDEYISQLKNRNIKQISVFKKEKEIIEHIEKKEIHTTYIRTNNNNILIVENTKENTKYYIGINENKYENYIPYNCISTEIEKEEYNDLINNKIQEQELLQKYLLAEKILHLQ